jgi:tetratricopeptide (TPR) repeat protein
MRAAFLIVSVMIATAAQAADTDEGAAKAHFAAGRSFFKDKRYRDAIDQFLQAYRLSAAGDLLYNIGICYDAVDDAGRATFYLQRYLEARRDAPERAEIEQSLYRLSSRVGRLIIHAPPEAEITIDGIAIEVVPPTPLLLTAGSHHVVARRHGEPLAIVDATITGGLSREISIAAPTGAAAPAMVTRERAAPRRMLKIVGIALISIGGAALVGGVVGSALAVNASNDVSNESQRHATFDPALQSRGQHAALAGDVLYGVGGAAVLTGVVCTVVALRGTWR